jgi:kinesin family protein 2/24
MRPIFEKELQNGEFESVSVVEESGEVIVHNCLFHADLIRMFVHHQGFNFPRTFGPNAKDEDVYAECGAALVSHALSGQLATLFMFGQTGSGKTYNMNTIVHLASQEIFGAIGDTAIVKLKVFEIAGKKCSDLLAKQQHVELKLLDDEDGRTQIVGATEATLQSSEDFSRLLREAWARRATASHGRNEESSRSHCICMIDLPQAGSLILVDCAGTERRQDTDQHSSERTRESAEINASLHALKECIRSRGREQRQAKIADRDEERHKQVHVPYRGSFLTRVLHESFTRPASYLAAFGTVSPASLDTEHTLGTLRTLQQLMVESGHTDSPSFEAKVDVDPKSALKSMGSRRNGGAGSPEQKPPLPPTNAATRSQWLSA